MFLVILTGIILFTITTWTIVGNTLVIIAFIIDKKIRQGGMSNYLIINLAISDLLLGIAVLPFSASYSTFRLWYFGKFLCETWLVIDVLCSTASIWNLLMIAFDRYIATNYPIYYRHHRHSIPRALSNICIAWFVSLAICLLPTLISEKKPEIYSHAENRTIPMPTKYNALTRQCELYKDENFVIISSLLSFYIPLIVMIFLYAKVLYAIKKQSLIRLKPSSTQRSNNDKTYRYFSTQQSEITVTDDELSSADQQQVGRREISAEARITRSLAIVIGCFICCWLPFFTLYIIRAVCNCLSFNAIELFFWLGYSNSSLNPVLYAILNKNFRVAFKNIISCKNICFS
ncbi:unnamed protein product [Adineta steineri]|uniref:G-protein coupled receptors family 1 profile domain-containing protein n=1 Tax=Adineta steineri TaxID=433720 RepID=A0A815CVZ0_9BILA|nr:unnamed protein product [Adineta steineri]CAF1373686.1 unnamed protein product [Adineta steineri]